MGPCLWKGASILSNPGTPFDQDGWADVVSDIRKLYLMMGGGSNDMNQASKGVDQSVSESGFPLLQNNFSEYINNPAAITQIKQNLALAPGLCYVKLTNSYTYLSSSDTTLILDTIVEDIGKCYNTATGVFVAPVAGIYNISVLVKNRSPAMQSAQDFLWQAFYSIKKNGTFIHEAVSAISIKSPNTTDTVEVPMAMSLNLRLTTGDLITLGDATSEDQGPPGTRYGSMRSGSFFTASWIPQ